MEAGVFLPGHINFYGRVRLVGSVNEADGACLVGPPHLLCVCAETSHFLLLRQSHPRFLHAL